MGKISLNVKSKKADDIEGLMKHRENSPSPTKTAQDDVSQHPSPTPKHPLTRTKAGCCRRACLFSLGVLVVLILFVSTACLVDYQQGNLATHTTSQLPKEVREVPSKVGKYVVEVLYQTPKDLHRIFDVALNWTRKNDSAPTSVINLGSRKMSVKDEILLDQTKEEELSSLYEESKDTLVDDGLEGIAQFFVGILNDVASMFTATTEELEDSGSPPNVEITNNAIDRKVVVVASSDSFEMTQPGVITIDNAHVDQVHSPEFFEHTTENEDDWNNEVSKVMEEIYPDDGTTRISSDKETLKNLLNDQGEGKKHTH